MNERPIGVSVLAVLHVIGGVLILGTRAMLFANLDRVSEGLSTVGMPPALRLLGLMLLAGIAVASGIGMWIGARWGWWCAAFYYVYSLARNGNALLVLSMVSEFADGSRGATYFYAKYGGRFVILLLLLMYFFKPNVLEYFEMHNIQKGKAVGILVAVTTVVFGLLTGAAFLL